MGIDAAVETALLAQLRTVAGIPAPAQWTVPNVPFDAEPGTPWLAWLMVYGDRTRLTAPARGAWMRLDGTLKVLLHVPIGTGADEVVAMAQAIQDAFPAGLSLFDGIVQVDIDGARRFTGGTDLTEGWYAVPVEIRWHVHSTNTL